MLTQDTTTKANARGQDQIARIEIHIEGGCVHDVRHIPKHIIVAVIDYDIDGVDPDRLSKLDNGEEVIISEHWSGDWPTKEAEGQ
jgi:hypothetical protein